MEKIRDNKGETFKYSFRNKASIVFRVEENQLYIMNFFGSDFSEKPFSASLFSVNTRNRQYEDTDYILKTYIFTEDRAEFDFQSEDNTLYIKSIWEFCIDTGVWKRKDILRNICEDDIYVTRCLSQIKLPSGEYGVYSQRSRWCNENEGFFHTHKHGSFNIGCEGGRTCQGSTPYIAIRNEHQNNGFALNVLPVGNWTIRAESVTRFWAEPQLVIKAGLADHDLNLRMPSNGTIKLPELIYYALPYGNMSDDLELFHKYINRNLVKSNFDHSPVIYNTWFLNFEHLDLKELRKQLDTAQKIGCEVFVIDAGWFGEGEGWYGLTGDWVEKKEGAFFGHMKDFADEVRKKGMTFGLWMEPERLSKTSNVVKKNPDWFVFNKYSGYYYPDLTNPDACNYLFGEIGRLLDTYGAGWIKLDYNVDFGHDIKRQEFYGYYKGFYAMMDELRSKYPSVFFEGCAGGGMRSDLNTVMHHDGHFLTDTVNPVHEINIFEGALLRLPPGRVIKWVALRSLGRTLPGFGAKNSEFKESIAAPMDAGWEAGMVVTPEFAVNAAFSGMMGFTSDIAGLPGDVLSYLNKAVEYFKKLRSVITKSHAFVLSPLRGKENYTGWTFHQLQSDDETLNLLFAYRMRDFYTGRTTRLKCLNPNAKYLITDYMDKNYAVYYTGEQLMHEGLEVHIEKNFSSRILEIKIIDK